MIHEVADSVISRQDFVEFLYSLKQDLLICSDEWENPTLDRFLDAIADWTASIESCSKNTGDMEILNAGWNTFAKILHAGKIYE